MIAFCLKIAHRVRDGARKSRSIAQVSLVHTSSASRIALSMWAKVSMNFWVPSTMLLLYLAKTG